LFQLFSQTPAGSRAREIQGERLRANPVSLFHLYGQGRQTFIVSRDQQEVLLPGGERAREILAQATRRAGDQGITCLRHVIRDLRLRLGNYPFSMRLLSCFFAAVQTMSNMFGKASLKNDVPNPARETKPSLHAAGGVM